MRGELRKKIKECQMCQEKFKPKSGHHLYCPSCSQERIKQAHKVKRVEYQVNACINLLQREGYSVIDKSEETPTSIGD